MKRCSRAGVRAHRPASAYHSRLQLESLEERVVLNGDVIMEWNAVALGANAVDHTAPAVPGGPVTKGPPASARALGIVHAAMFDAYNSINPNYTPYLMLAPNAAGASIDAAVAQAAHDTLASLFPAQAASFATALQLTLARVPDGPAEIQGIAVGSFVAGQILAERANDGANVPGTYTPTGEPGNHNVDPLHPNQGFLSPGYGVVTPFVVPDITAFRAPAPPSLSSSAYAAALNEVKRLGGDGTTTPTVRTADQTLIASYWSYDGSAELGTPPRMYNQIARVIAEQQGNTVAENARMFALLNLAMADAGISAWDTKYTYDLWRPILGIRNADSDGNSRTTADPNWVPLGASRSNPAAGETNFTPPFPAYTSGHATFGAAVLKTLANFYQTDNISFTFISDEWNNTTKDQFNELRPIIPRAFTSLSQASAENAASRVFNGVHWRFDGTEGVRAGNAIADYAFENILRPLSGGPDAISDSDFAGQIDAYLRGHIPGGTGIDITIRAAQSGDIEVVDNRTGIVMMSQLPAAAPSVVLYGTTGADRIVLDFSGGAFQVPFVVDGLGGLDVLTILGSNGADTALLNGSRITIANTDIEFNDFIMLNVSTGGGNDTVVVASPVAAIVTIDGGAGDDLLMGSDGNEVLIGGSGNDILVGRGGNDLLFGGTGNDLLIGGDGIDGLFGDGGNDILIGGSTASDNNEAELREILRIWTDDSLRLQQRMAMLSALYLNGTTIQDDGKLDLLHGGAGADWFPSPGDEDIVDQ